MFVYIRGTAQNVLEPLLEFFEKIISLQNTYLFYPTIIKALIEKLNVLLNVPESLTTLFITSPDAISS